MRIDVLRRRAGASESFWQSFSYTPQEDAETVATALTRLNEAPDLRDVNGDAAPPIRWACSCLQRKCGACAMVINGRPGLACDARLSELGKRITLEPFRKFPVVEDLLSDRSALYENLTAMRVWLDGDAEHRHTELSYEASRCLQCGCCLEVCPNFAAGGTFAGMSAAVPLSRLLAELPTDRRAELAAIYNRRVYRGCGKSLACRNICPANIDIDRLLARSSAAAVWKRLERTKRI